MRAVRSLVALTVLLAGCQTDGMVFQRDESIEIITPAARDEVDLPVVITWRPDEDLAAEVDASGGELFYAVFVDRPPIRVGSDLTDLVSGTCRRQPGCADLAWFHDRGIYVTSVPVLTLHELDDLREGEEGRDLHEVTIVVMRENDETAIRAAASGTRLGEAAFTREFYIDRSGDS